MNIEEIKPSAIARMIELRNGDVPRDMTESVKRKQASTIETPEAAWKLWEMIITHGLYAKMKAEYPDVELGVEKDVFIHLRISHSAIEIEAWQHQLSLIPRNIIIDPLLLDLDVPAQATTSERQEIYKEFVCELLKDVIDRPTQLEGESKNTKALDKHKQRVQANVVIWNPGHRD